MRRAILTAIASVFLLLSCANDDPVWVGSAAIEGPDTIAVSIQILNRDNVCYAMTLEIDGSPAIEGTVPDEDGGHCDWWTGVIETRLERGPHTFVVSGDEVAEATFDLGADAGVLIEYSSGDLRIANTRAFCR